MNELPGDGNLAWGAWPAGSTMVGAFVGVVAAVVRIDGKEPDRVLRAIHRRPQDLRHADVDLHEVPSTGVGGGAGRDDVDHAADQHAHVRRQERSGLDLEMQLASRALGELPEVPSTSEELSP